MQRGWTNIKVMIQAQNYRLETLTTLIEQIQDQQQRVAKEGE